MTKKQDQLKRIRTLLSNPDRQEHIKIDMECHLSFCFGWQHKWVVTQEEVEEIVKDCLPDLPIKVKVEDYQITLSPTTPLPDQPIN